MFIPVESAGSTSYGRTNAEGEYELMFSRTAYGASIGKSNVRLTTRELTTGPDGRDAFTPELIPAQYRDGTALTVEVGPGANVIDLDLLSKGA